MNNLDKDLATKVPAVTLGFWIIKILATTLGETGGDSVSMSWLGETTPEAGEDGVNGYLAGTAIFGAAAGGAGLGADPGAALQPVALLGDHRRIHHGGHHARGFRHPFARHRLSRRVAAAVRAGADLAVRRGTASTGTISVNTVADRRAETFYWITITFSQTLGTALGDWIADSGLGYGGGVLFFGAALLVLAVLYFWTQLSRVFLFWTAFILTRPLGATVGDYLDKPRAEGGLELSRPLASLVLAVAMIVLILPHPAARRPASGFQRSGDVKIARRDVALVRALASRGGDRRSARSSPTIPSPPTRDIGKSMRRLLKPSGRGK